ncbi:MAG: isopentenyl-diphosphate Delta-isomerase [Candidatus Saccharibacteria bacterium]|nr:isopentenyl-diphosphate Delta-isomerase [Candidatus Saccharibacteria bacterium]
MTEEERIVFVDESGQPTGETGPKLASHHMKTRLHLAFSCYIFNDKGQFLVTQRALSKKVWPGVLTNSVCGHPAPGEPQQDAISRRAAHELGLTDLTDLTCVVPDYIYKTPAMNGVIEHEFCPIYVSRTTTDPALNFEEVANYKWLNWEVYKTELRERAAEYSYWAKDQLQHLENSSAFNTWLKQLNEAAI